MSKFLSSKLINMMTNSITIPDLNKDLPHVYASHDIFIAKASGRGNVTSMNEAMSSLQSPPLIRLKLHIPINFTREVPPKALHGDPKAELNGRSTKLKA